MQGNPPEVDEILDLNDFFEGDKRNRVLKKEYQWNVEIVERLNNIKCEKFEIGRQYELHLVAHLSIAFYLGYSLTCKQGYFIYPIQRCTGEYQCWMNDTIDTTKYSRGEIKLLDKKAGQDSILILSIKNDILAEVIKYLEKSCIEYGKIFEYKLDPECKKMIECGNQACEIVDYIKREMNSNRTDKEMKGTLHIFPSAPVGLIFLLGQVSASFGKTQIYEYDFDKMGSCTYSPSICLPIII